MIKTITTTLLSTLALVTMAATPAQADLSNLYQQQQQQMAAAEQKAHDMCMMYRQWANYKSSDDRDKTTLHTVYRGEYAMTYITDGKCVKSAHVLLNSVKNHDDMLMGNVTVQYKFEDNNIVEYRVYNSNQMKQFLGNTVLRKVVANLTPLN